MEVAGKTYDVYPVFYPIGNGMMNIDKAVEDLEFIIKNTEKRLAPSSALI